MGKPYVIRVSSQKGGVGKTTIAVNLATALQSSGYKVLLVDSDRSSPAVGEYFGIKNQNAGYLELLDGDAEVKNSIFAYQPIDLSIVTGSYAKKAYEQEDTAEGIEGFYNQIDELGYDFVIVDAAPGPIPQGTAKFYDESIIVTTPERISCAGSRRLAEQCEKLHLSYRLVLNRSGYSSYDLSTDQIQSLYGDLIDITIPEDEIVAESRSRNKPAQSISGRNSFVRAIGDLSRVYSIRAGGEDGERKGSSSGVLGKLIGRR